LIFFKSGDKYSKFPIKKRSGIICIPYNYMQHGSNHRMKAWVLDTNPRFQAGVGAKIIIYCKKSIKKQGVISKNRYFCIK